MWSNIECNMFTWANGTFLYAAIPTAKDRQCFAELLSQDVIKILVKSDQ